MRRLIALVVIALVAAAIGVFAGRQSTRCRYAVTNEAEFIHLGHSSVIILAGSTVDRIFGGDSKNLTLFYGFNRMVNRRRQNRRTLCRNAGFTMSTARPCRRPSGHRGPRSPDT